MPGAVAPVSWGRLRAKAGGAGHRWQQLFHGSFLSWFDGRKAEGGVLFSPIFSKPHCAVDPL